MTERGLYVHVPFCDHICYYCDFNKVLATRQPVDDYLEAVGKELMLYAEQGAVHTIYIGGGTPTALSQKQLIRLLREIRTAFPQTVTEFTVEANPENVSDDKLSAMRAAGVDRLSLGVQTFNDRLLRQIGRLHTGEIAEQAVRRARAHGLTNISIDLMFALPGQTEADLHESLERAFALEVPHISVYALQVEPKTVYYNQLRRGDLLLPGEDIEADMYGQIMLAAERHGLSQYEISNFARPGSEGVHNSFYWRNGEYYGVGAGAHGYVDGVRYANAGPVKQYMAAVNAHGCARTSTHAVSVNEQIEEELFLGLRLRKGVSRTVFAGKFGCTLESIYGVQISALKKKGLLEEEGDHIRLTRRGLFFGNDVFSAFLLS
ncbi:MAG: radical SAM family heme chaperone HemW [Sporolactobacillus sp.]